MTTLETLKAARAKIANPVCWTQGANAKDADGVTTAAYSFDAVCWCAQGALRAVTFHERPMFGASWSLLADVLGGADEDDPNPVVVFNDTHTHAEVLALFDKAIASLETPAVPA